jgi:uncharacterized membrane protein YeaQ/YmgE (transglycosylase-associated protein family)
MPMITWIVLGLVAGFIASKIVNRTGEGVLIDVLLGIVGAIVGGWLFNVFGMRGVSGLNLYSMVVAVIGAAVVLALYHAVFGRSRLRRRFLGGALLVVLYEARKAPMGRHGRCRMARAATMGTSTNNGVGSFVYWLMDSRHENCGALELTST